MIANRLRQITTWLHDSVNGRVFAAATLIAVLSILVKLTSLGKEVLIARSFGASDSLDCFYVAFIMPTFVIGILANSCADAFIPTYIEVREQESFNAAQRLFSSVAFLYVAILIVVSVLLAVLQQWFLPVLGSSFSPSKIALTRALFFPLLITLLLSGLNGLWKAALNAHECFALTAIAPIFIPASIAVILLLHVSDWRIYALVIGLILGVTGELACNGYGLSRRGIPVIPRWYGFDKPVGQVLAQALPAAAAAALMGSTAIVDQSMAAMLGSGSVSAFNYANKLIPVLLAMGTNALSVAVFPTLSRLSANRDCQGMRRVISFYSRLIMVVTLPVMVILIVLSDQIVTVVFQRGAFTAETAHLVGRVQSLLTLELPFYALCILSASAICALKRTRVLLWGTCICVIANVALNYVFMKLFSLPGIALSTSAVYAISFLYLRTMLDRALEELGMVGSETAGAMVSAVELG